MTGRSRLILAGLLVLFATSAQAGIVTVDTIGGLGGTPVEFFTSFAVGSGMGGSVDFRNLTGLSWIGLTITVVDSSPSAVTCGPSNVFSSCSVSSVGTTHTFSFSGGTLANNQRFRITWAAWSESTTLSSVATPVPEPGSLVLLGSGLLGLGTLLRRKYHRAHRG